MKNFSEPKKNENKDAAKTSDPMFLSDSEFGDVKIHDGVISSIVRNAVLEVEGVSRLSGSALVDNFAELVGSRKMQSRSISVAVDKDNRVTIEVKIIMKFGFFIPEVAENVQKNVISEVEKFTGMNVCSVHVLIQDIENVSEDEDENQEQQADENK